MMLWPKWRVEQPIASVFLHLTVAVPFVALASRFIVNDTSILHVAMNGGEDLLRSSIDLRQHGLLEKGHC